MYCISISDWKLALALGLGCGALATAAHHLFLYSSEIDYC